MRWKRRSRKLLSYLSITQAGLGALTKAEEYQPDHFLKMDHYSKFNLELARSIRTGKKQRHFVVAF